MSPSDPLAGWSTTEREWVTTIGRQVYSDDVFSVDLSSLPRHHIRSENDILTSAMKYVGAERVSNEDFWALTEEGHPVSILHGRDFVVWSLPQRAVCDCRHEYRMAVRWGPKANGKFAQRPDSISTASLFGSVAPRRHLRFFDVRFTNVAKIGSEHCEYSGSGPGRYGQPDDH